jgi:hypothetical protein
MWISLSFSLCVYVGGGLALGLAAINISYKKGNTRKEIIQLARPPPAYVAGRQVTCMLSMLRQC